LTDSAVVSASSDINASLVQPSDIQPSVVLVSKPMVASPSQVRTESEVFEVTGAEQGSRQDDVTVVEASLCFKETRTAPLGHMGSNSVRLIVGVSVGVMVLLAALILAIFLLLRPVSSTTDAMWHAEAAKTSMSSGLAYEAKDSYRSYGGDAFSSAATQENPIYAATDTFDQTEFETAEQALMMADESGHAEEFDLYADD
jgi:hypothetical protein